MSRGCHYIPWSHTAKWRSRTTATTQVHRGPGRVATSSPDVRASGTRGLYRIAASAGCHAHGDDEDAGYWSDNNANALRWIRGIDLHRHPAGSPVRAQAAPDPNSRTAARNADAKDAWPAKIRARHRAPRYTPSGKRDRSEPT